MRLLDAYSTKHFASKFERSKCSAVKGASTVEFANRVEPDEAAHNNVNEPPHLELACLSSSH